MDSYIGRTKTEDKKESVIGAVKKQKAEERRNPKGKIRISKEAEIYFYSRYGHRNAPALFVKDKIERISNDNVRFVE